jgi:hypothetical protein
LPAPCAAILNKCGHIGPSDEPISASTLHHVATAIANGGTARTCTAFSVLPMWAWVWVRMLCRSLPSEMKTKSLLMNVI